MNFLRIDPNALAHNFNQIKTKLSASTRVIAVVKANAYGHGAVEVARQLVALGADYLAVAYAQEGQVLRQAGITLPIMVFYPQPDSFQRIIDQKLEPVLYSKYVWKQFTALLTSGQKPYPVHIKYNTGLNRIGFAPEETEWVIEAGQTSPVRLISVYSHLGESEGLRPHKGSNRQISSFLSIKQQHEKDTHHQPWFHLLNSSGIFNYPELHLDAVRCGIGLYGFANHPKWDRELRPIARLESQIVQIHTLQKGEKVGYNQGWTAPHACRIATLPLGHADGIGRHFGGQKAVVYLGKHKVPILGNICMDMLMIDISAIPCQLGDRVEFFGVEQTAADFAAAGQTISYELLTGLGPRILRIWEAL